MFSKCRTESTAKGELPPLWCITSEAYLYEWKGFGSQILVFSALLCKQDFHRCIWGCCRGFIIREDVQMLYRCTAEGGRERSGWQDREMKKKHGLVSMVCSGTMCDLVYSCIISFLLTPASVWSCLCSKDAIIYFCLQQNSRKINTTRGMLLWFIVSKTIILRCHLFRIIRIRPDNECKSCNYSVLVTTCWDKHNNDRYRHNLWFIYLVHVIRGN